MEKPKFTWLPKFTATLEKVPDEQQRNELLWALVQYGTNDVEPSLEWPLNALFEGLREDIDNSKNCRASGKSGGRGNKKETSQDEKSPLLTPLLTSEKGGTPPIPYQTIPNHTKPNQEKRECAPAVREVVDYLNAKTGKHFKPSATANAKRIKARLADGYTVADLKAVIDIKTAEWLGVTSTDGRDMGQYLCPEVLFGIKFERYLNQQSKGGANHDEYSAL